MTQHQLVLRLSAQALLDLESIWFYTRTAWSQRQADQYFNELVAHFDFLKSNSFCGKSIDEIRIGYRVSPVNSHLVFYRVTDDHFLEIVRILHQNVDINSWL